MKTVKACDIYDFINSFAPFDTQLSYDNSGLLVGDPDTEVTDAVVALDITSLSIAKAKQCGAQLIISHHPVMFSPIKTLPADSMPYRLAASGLTALCVHTNFDMCTGGISDALAQALELTDIRPFLPEGTGTLAGRMGKLRKSMKPCELAAYVKEKLSAEYICYADGGREISTVAVIGGGAGEYARACALEGADAMVTGEAKHHQMLESVELSMTLIPAGHYATEVIGTRRLMKLLEEEFPCVRFSFCEDTRLEKRAEV